MTTAPRLLPFLAALSLSSLATSQVIVWGPVMPTLGPSDVSVDGTLVVARNLHGAGAAQTPAVNGITFVGGFAPLGWNNASTNALLSTTGDAGYDLLLSSARASSGPVGNPTGWGAIRIDNLAALTVGYDYEIQCWFTDQRDGGALQLYDRAMTLSSAVGPATLTNGEVNNLGSLLQGPLSGPLDADWDNNPALGGPDVVFGSYCIGRFSRLNSTDQIWLLVQGSHPDPTVTNVAPHVTALQIRRSLAFHESYGSGCYAPNPLRLSASPAPVFAVGGSSVPITWQVTNLVDLSPALPGAFVAALVFSLSPPIGGSGIDLTTIGIDAPGCNLLVGSLDLLWNVTPTASSHGETIVVPPPLTPGTVFYTQAVNFVIPNSLPGGLNNFGVITSNGVKTDFDVF